MMDGDNQSKHFGDSDGGACFGKKVRGCPDEEFGYVARKNTQINTDMTIYESHFVRQAMAANVKTALHFIHSRYPIAFRNRSRFLLAIQTHISLPIAHANKMNVLVHLNGAKKKRQIFLFESYPPIESIAPE